MACPRPADAEKMARSGSADVFAHLRRDFEDAIARQGARHASREALSPFRNGSSRRASQRAAKLFRGAHRP
jgi:hypothetical protein